MIRSIGKIPVNQVLQIICSSTFLPASEGSAAPERCRCVGSAGIAVPWDTRLFVMERERDKTLGAAACGEAVTAAPGSVGIPPPGAMERRASCWGSLTCVLRCLWGFLGRGRLRQNLKMQMFGIILQVFSLLMSIYFILKGCGGWFALGTAC